MEDSISVIMKSTISANSKTNLVQLVLDKKLVLHKDATITEDSFAEYTVKYQDCTQFRFAVRDGNVNIRYCSFHESLLPIGFVLGRNEYLYHKNDKYSWESNNHFTPFKIVDGAIVYEDVYVRDNTVYVQDLDITSSGETHPELGPGWIRIGTDASRLISIVRNNTLKETFMLAKFVQKTRCAYDILNFETYDETYYVVKTSEGIKSMYPDGDNIIIHNHDLSSQMKQLNMCSKDAHTTMMLKPIILKHGLVLPNCVIQYVGDHFRMYTETPFSIKEFKYPQDSAVPQSFGIGHIDESHEHYKSFSNLSLDIIFGLNFTAIAEIILRGNVEIQHTILSSGDDGTTIKLYGANRKLYYTINKQTKKETAPVTSSPGTSQDPQPDIMHGSVARKETLRLFQDKFKSNLSNSLSQGYFDITTGNDYCADWLQGFCINNEYTCKRTGQTIWTITW